jgi:adenosyl cobinamide kinase/adenosyl cobinamide phosphate guanylyltransferase
MIFITGPLFAGKRSYIRQALGLSQAELAERAVWDVQALAADAPDLTALAQELSGHEIVIATEVGGGVVPVDARQRADREAAGRLACLLAARADTVIRVCCGLPQLLKGAWPC